VCNFSPWNPARNAHASYNHLLSARSTIFFPLYLINCTLFEKKKVTEKIVLIFSTIFFWNISHSKKKWARYTKCIFVFMWITLYSFPTLMKLEFSQQTLEITSNTIFHENPFSRRRVVPCGRMDGRTDGRTDMTKLIVAFRSFTNSIKERWIPEQTRHCTEYSFFICHIQTPIH
jgi:hypothetical protein